MTYKDIQQIVIKRYRIILDEHSLCWGRTHAHVKERRVCKWHPASSMQATFKLLHEIGHIETTTGGMRRCESEYHATQWALRRAAEFGLDVPEKIIKKYQDYIDTELDRGKRRGGSRYPASLKLKKR